MCAPPPWEAAGTREEVPVVLVGLGGTQDGDQPAPLWSEHHSRAEMGSPARKRRRMQTG